MSTCPQGLYQACKQTPHHRFPMSMHLSPLGREAVRAPLMLPPGAVLGALRLPGVVRLRSRHRGRRGRRAHDRRHLSVHLSGTRAGVVAGRPRMHRHRSHELAHGGARVGCAAGQGTHRVHPHGGAHPVAGRDYQAHERRHAHRRERLVRPPARGWTAACSSGPSAAPVLCCTSAGACSTHCLSLSYLSRPSLHED